MHLNVTNNPVMVNVLVNTLNPEIRFVSCVAHDTKLVLHRLNLTLCLNYLNLSTNKRFFRAIIHPRNLV